MTGPTFSAESSEYDPTDTAAECGGPGWVLEPARAALLVHDLLPYYVQVLAPLTRSWLLDGCASAVRWAQDRRVPVIASAPRPANQIEQRGLGGGLWGLGPSPLDAGTTCLPDLEAEEVTWVRKRSLSTFYATDLEVELRRRGRSQLVIVGVFASQGILATTFDALARDVAAFVVCDAIADTGEDLHVQALRQISRSTGQVIARTHLR